MNDEKLKVMHFVSTLYPGGAERVAVNILNNLDRRIYLPFLATSRDEGMLKDYVFSDVEFISLYRKSIFDIKASYRIINFVKQKKINIIHAHGYTIFLSLFIKFFIPNLIVIWHNHMSKLLYKTRAPLHFYLAGKLADAIIVPSNNLSAWTLKKIKVSSDKIFYVPNFIDNSNYEMLKNGDELLLRNRKSRRIICVANIKPDKDQKCLIKAFNIVRKVIPDSHLLLVGNINDNNYYEELLSLVANLDISEQVTFLGPKKDIQNLLTQSEIGVLSSRNEAFPMVLIEYGYSKLPVVASNVGQCSEILENGKSGLLFEPANFNQLADHLIQLLTSDKDRMSLGSSLYDRVISVYSVDQVISRYMKIYSIFSNNMIR